MNIFLKSLFDLAKTKILDWFGNVKLFAPSKSTEGKTQATTNAEEAVAIVQAQKGFSDLVQDQFDYLIDKLNEYQKGYYEISEHTKTINYGFSIKFIPGHN